MAKKKGNEVKAETISILLNVPKDIYFDIKDKADKITRSGSEKKTIHDQMIDDLQLQNPAKRRK